MTDNLKIGLVGAGGAVIGGLLNGAYQHALDWFRQPQLRIDYEGTEANKVDVEYQQGDKSIAEVYIRARVRNTGRRIARGCRVFLVALNEVHSSGATTQTVLRDSLVLAWAGYHFEPRDVPRGVEFFADVMRVSKHQPGWLFSVERLFASHARLKDYRGTYRFCLMVTGDNTSPSTCEIDVMYDGDWHNLRALQHR